MPNENPSLKKNLILSKNLEPKELDRQCALWACMCGFDEPQFPPPTPPLLLERRREMASLKPGEYIGEDPLFWKQEEISKFLDEKWTINLKNKVNYEHLVWVKDSLSSIDTEYLVKVRNKLYDYRQFFKEEAKRELPFKNLTPKGE